MEETQQTDRLVAGRRRVIILVAGIALLSMALGMVLSRRIMSPEESAARTAPPEAANVTAPVERRVVESQVLTRGDFVYEGAVDVSIETGSLTANPVVTGQLPRVGDPVDAGAVLLQVAGRPVIVLPGEVPAYRDLRPGLAGLDVTQLKQALVAMGLDPGDPANDLYDQATSAAVTELYNRVGYTAPTPDETRTDALDTAREQVTVAEDNVAMAQQDLAAAGTPPTYSELLSADAQVGAAQRSLDEARLSDPPTPGAVADAEYQLAIAQAQRDELHAPKDTSFQQAALNRAQTRLGQAQTVVTELASTTGTALPAAEVVFLPNLPRRIDSVAVTRGKPIDGPVLRVSGADLVVVANMSATDGGLVTAGMPAQMQLGDSVIDGTVTAVRPAAQAQPDATVPEGDQPPEDGGGGSTGRRLQAVISPGALTPEQVVQVQGQNVRVTIPVQASAGEVLAVPLAALSAGPSGESRVTKQLADGSTERVTVEVGLTAGGYAEIRPQDDTALTEGDRVVVGR